MFLNLLRFTLTVLVKENIVKKSQKCISRSFLNCFNVGLLLACLFLLWQQSWLCLQLYMSEPTAIKISTVPLTAKKTPSFVLCHKSVVSAFAQTFRSHYDIYVEEYRFEGVWENNLTKADNLSVEQILDILVDSNFR